MVMFNVASGDLGIYPEITNSHRLEKQAESGKIVHQIPRASTKGGNSDGRIHEIPGIGYPYRRFRTQVRRPCMNVLHDEYLFKRIDVGRYRQFAQGQIIIGYHVLPDCRNACLGRLKSRQRTNQPAGAFRRTRNIIHTRNVAFGNRFHIFVRIVQSGVTATLDRLWPSTPANNVSDFLQIMIQALHHIKRHSVKQLFQTNTP